MIIKYLDDAKILLANRRYSTAIYLAGYALELALKYRICMIMKFNSGFPENRIEFNHYFSDTKRSLLRSTIRELRDIRHHKLELLLRYSGEQYHIETNFSSDWNEVKDWNPEMRYEKYIIRKQRANNFLNSTENIINGII